MLILTAIVVGVATLALGLALVVRIHEAYRTIEEDEIVAVIDARGPRRMSAPRAGGFDWSQHLPALQVVVPLVSALVCGAVRAAASLLADHARLLAGRCR